MRSCECKGGGCMYRECEILGRKKYRGSELRWKKAYTCVEEEEKDDVWLVRVHEKTKGHYWILNILRVIKIRSQTQTQTHMSFTKKEKKEGKQKNHV